MAVDLTAREAELRKCVRRVYQVFGSYKLARYIQPDRCFPNFCDDRPLRADSLCRLPAAAFKNYQWKAITTWGTVDDFKHFLPRMLELIAFPNSDPQPTLEHGVPACVELDMVSGKLEYGQWHRWPKAEHNAIQEYSESLWASILATMPSTEPCGVWTAQNELHVLSSFHEDLTPFLLRWETDAADPTDGFIAAAHLAVSVLDVQRRLLDLCSTKRELAPPAGTTNDQTLNWLASDRVAELLEAAFFRWAESPYAETISQAHDWLGWCRRRWNDA